MTESNTVGPGTPDQLGATLRDGGVNFLLLSYDAGMVTDLADGLSVIIAHYGFSGVTLAQSRLAVVLIEIGGR